MLRALAAVSILTASLALAADKPNLSGSWKMDAKQSNFGDNPGPDSFARKVEHSEPSVIFTDEQKSPLGEEKAVRKYTTDGKEMTYQWMGSEVKSAAHWEGDKLITVGKLDASGAEVVINGTVTLSADGKTLTEEDHVFAGGNEVATFKIVMVKQ
jgi:hypothetical protein